MRCCETCWAPQVMSQSRTHGVTWKSGFLDLWSFVCLILFLLSTCMFPSIMFTYHLKFLLIFWDYVCERHPVAATVRLFGTIVARFLVHSSLVCHPGNTKLVLRSSPHSPFVACIKIFLQSYRSSRMTNLNDLDLLPIHLATDFSISADKKWWCEHIKSHSWASV